MSNNTVQCNETQIQSRSNSLVLVMTDTFNVIIFGSILVFLLLVLKKKAWESPVKRLGLTLIIFIALSSLTFALLDIFIHFTTRWCAVSAFFSLYWDISILLYLSALLVALLLQATAPIIPERWRHKHRYTPKARYIEIVLHISIFILTLLISSVSISTVENCCHRCCISVVLLDIIICPLLALSALILVFTILILGFFFCKFRRTHVITTTIKWAVAKLGVVFMAVVVYIPFIIVGTTIEQKFIYHNIVFVDIIFGPVVVELVILLPLIMVIYLPGTLCHKCLKKTPDRLPLLPNTDMQQTTPSSEWDHSNVPSNTVSVHPNEMSDCETDHVSSLTVPRPKYGSIQS